MPRYFFDICDERGRIPDEEGTVCPNFDAALQEARTSARDLVNQHMEAGRSIAGSYIAIRNEDGGVVARMPFITALGKLH